MFEVGFRGFCGKGFVVWVGFWGLEGADGVEGGSELVSV